MILSMISKLASHSLKASYLKKNGGEEGKERGGEGKKQVPGMGHQNWLEVVS